MSKRVIVTNQTKNTNRFIKKYGGGIVSNKILEGRFIVTKYRKYSCFSEVDVTFIGKIKCRIFSIEQPEWYTKEGLYTKGKNISKIRLNKLLRKNIFSDVRNHLRFFNIDLHGYYDIKKINWQ